MTDLINKSEAAHRRKCRRELLKLAKQAPRITKKYIVEQIQFRYPEVHYEIGKTALGKGVIEIECNHGQCDRIGQFVMQYFPKQVYTYSACHIFRKGRLFIYFKR